MGKKIFNEDRHVNPTQLDTTHGKHAAPQERVFTKLSQTAEITKFAKEEYDRYGESLKVYRYWKYTIATAEHKAVERGLKKGLKQEKKEGGLHKTLETAQQMIANGIPPSVIAQYTRLNETEFNKAP